MRTSGIFRFCFEPFSDRKRGVKCGRILDTSFLISHRNALHGDNLLLSEGVPSEKSEFKNKLRLFVIPVQVL